MMNLLKKGYQRWSRLKGSRTLRNLFIALIVIGSFLIVANVVVDNPYAHALFRKHLNQYLEQTTDLRINFEASQLKIAPLEVKAYGLSIYHKDFPKIKILEADRITARVSLWSLLMNQPQLSVLELADVKVKYPLDKDVMAALFPEQPSEPSQFQLTWPLKIDYFPIQNIVIKHSQIYIEMPPKHPNELSPMRLSASDVNLNVQIHGPDEIDVELMTNHFALQSDDIVIFKDARIWMNPGINKSGNITGSYLIQNDLLELTGALNSFLQMNTDDRFMEQIVLNPQLKLKGDLAYLGRIFNIDKTKGPVRAKGSASIIIPLTSKKAFKFVVRANAQVEDGRIDDFRLHDVDTQVIVDLNKLTFKHAKVSIANQLVANAQGHLTLDKRLDFEFTGQLTQVPFSEIFGIFNIDFQALEAKISTDSIKVTGQGKPFSLEVSSQAQFQDINFPAISWKPVANNQPSCMLNVQLLSTDKYLSFNRTHGTCQPSSELKNSVDEPILVKRNRLELTGQAFYNQEKGMNLKIEAFDFSNEIFNAYSPIKVSGKSHIVSDIEGAYSSLVMRSNVTTQALALNDLFLNQGRGVVEYYVARNELRVYGLSITTTENERIEIEQARFPFDQWDRSQLSFHLNNLQEPFIQGFFMKLFGLNNISFNVEKVDANLEGDVRLPLSLMGRFNIELSEGKQGKTKLFDRISATINSDNKSIQLKMPVFQIEDFFLNTSLDITRHLKDFSRQLLVDRLGLSSQSLFKLKSKSYLPSQYQHRKSKKYHDQLQILPYIGPAFEYSGLQGRLNLQLELEGTLDRLAGKADLNFHELRVFSNPIAPANIHALIVDNQLDATLNQGGDQISSHILANLNQDSDFSYNLYLNLKHADLRFVASKLFAQDPRNFIYLDGHAQLKGSLKDFWRSTGDIAIDQIYGKFINSQIVSDNAIDFKSTQPFVIKLQQGYWRIFNGNNTHKAEIHSSSFRLSLETGDNRLPDHLDLRMESSLNLATLAPLFNSIESASGTLKAQAKITGSLSNPQFFTEITSDNNLSAPSNTLDLTVANYRPGFSDIKHHISIENKLVKIHYIQANKGSGTLKASGMIDFSENGASRSRVNIDFQNIDFNTELKMLRNLQTKLSGSVSIVGNKKPFLLTGEVNVDQAFSSANLDIRQQIIDFFRKKMTVSEEKLVDDSWFNLDLRFRAQESIRMKNKNLDVILSSDLNLKGDFARPILLGQIEVNKGIFNYKYEREFKIEQGLITFDNPSAINPRLDILAISQVSNYRIFMAITGSASDPQLELSADPPTKSDGTPLSKLDILLLLSTGSLPPSNTSASTIENTARAEALNVIIGQFEAPVEKIFDLSGQTLVRQVYIDTFIDQNNTIQPRLNFPLNLNQDWNIIFRVENKNVEVSLGYDINEDINISGKIDNKLQEESNTVNENAPITDTGVDVRFHFSFP